MLGALTPAGRRHRVRRHRGLTLVELMVVVAIVAVLAAIALPSMREFIARKRLEGLAQELVADLRLIKSHQIHYRPNTGTAISFGSTDAKICYILYVRGNNVLDCDCSASADVMCGPASASGLRPAPIRQVDIPLSAGISMTASLNPLVMGSYNGMPQFNRALRVTLTSTSAGHIVVSTNPTGVPSICSASGAFSSIRPCE